MNTRLDVTITNSRSSDSTQAFIENVTNLIRGGYSFTSNILGGHSKADFNIGCSTAKAWQILNEYLGKRVLISSPMSPYTDMSVWEGIVYSVKIDDGRTAINRSLETVYNSVWIPNYSNGLAPTVLSDTTSQTLWGTRELCITTTAKYENWANIREIMLKQYKDPRAVQTASSRGGNVAYPESIVSIQCAGIWEQWGRKLYRSVAGTSQTSSTILNSYLTYYPNAYQSTDRTHLQTNTNGKSKVATPTFTTLQTKVGQLCAYGDASYNRWQFGFYENGNPYFESEPTSPTYRMSRFDKGERIYDYTTGVEVPAFMVRPGKIVEVSDIMPDSLTYTTHLGDPRRMVIAEVTYTSPGGLTMSPQIQNPGQVRLDRLALRV